MKDKKFKKQLEEFGIEYTQAISEEPKEKPISQNLNVVKNIMSTMEGRAWMCSKLVLCGANTQPYVPGERTHDTAFACGMMEIGRHFQEEILRAAPDEYFLMIQEANATALNTPKQS